MDEHAEYAVDDKVRAVSTEHGIVLLDLKHGMYYSLNPVGALIFEHLQAGLNKEQILSHLHERFAGSRDTIASDIDRFLKDLYQKQICSHDKRIE